uniref:Uncharacterized protein n=1 Tax=Photinus pyralis TaxID=7054 RepID=A0A1Y1NK67_PHOPY
MDNINFLKQTVDKLKNNNTVPFTVSDVNLVNQSRYELNNSKSKWVCVGLSVYRQFTPMVRICGSKTAGVSFDKSEWKLFTDNQNLITNYFCSTEGKLLPIKVGFKTITSEVINNTKVIKIVDNGECDIYMAFGSLQRLWLLANLITYRLEMLTTLEFDNFYNKIINASAEMTGDYIENIMSIITPLQDLHDQNTAVLMEVVLFVKDKLMWDAEIIKSLN